MAKGNKTAIVAGLAAGASALANSPKVEPVVKAVKEIIPDPSALGGHTVGIAHHVMNSQAMQDAANSANLKAAAWGLGTAAVVKGAHMLLSNVQQRRNR